MEKENPVNIPEATIRHALASQLGVLENGLRFVRENYELENHSGTKGFIDILAMDAEHRYVVIELKRASASSRDALHEIFKYVALISQNLGVRDYEVRSIIVSTHWNELFVPFSKMISSTTLQLKGYRLNTDNLDSLVATEVKPASIDIRRRLAGGHKIYYANDRSDSLRISDALKDQLQLLGIDDYVIVMGNAPEPAAHRYSLLVYLAIQAYSDIEVVEKLYEFETAHPLPADDPESFWNTRFQWYEQIRDGTVPEGEVFDFLRMNVNDLILSFSSGHYNRISSFLAEELLFLLKVQCDDIERSDPVKFESIFDIQGWQVQDITCAGIFDRDVRFKDLFFDDEIRGYDGANAYKYYNTCTSTNRRKLDDIIDLHSNCLTFNPRWKKRIAESLRVVSQTNDAFDLAIRIFNPTSLWPAFKKLLNDEDFEKYLPKYELLVCYHGSEKLELNVGRLYWTGEDLAPGDHYELFQEARQQVIFGSSHGSFHLLSDFHLVYDTERYRQFSLERVPKQTTTHPDGLQPFEVFWQKNREHIRRLIHDAHPSTLITNV